MLAGFLAVLIIISAVLAGNFLSKSIKGEFEKLAAQAEKLKDLVGAFKLLEK